MRTLLRSSFLLFLFLCSTLSARAQEKECVDLAKKFLKAYNNNQFTTCREYCDSSVKNLLTDSLLAQSHRQLGEKSGKFIAQEDSLFEDNHTFYLVYLGCRFEKLSADYKFAFSPVSKKIVGFFLVPPVSKKKYVLPSYAKPDDLIEQSISIITDSFDLPGILTIPKSASHPPPVVILVQGSGPSDYDETVKNNKPFRDLAVGLAAKGIASIRYSKRTFVYGNQSMADITKLTPKEEVTDDALNAIRLAHRIYAIDTGRIFLLGHSLGAFLAPRIAEEEKQLRGIILMAAPARRLEDMLFDQKEFLLPQQAPTLADSLIAVAAKQRDRVKNHNYTETTDGSELMGIMPAYWDYLSKYDQIKTAKSLSIPMLFLQGDRDYQVGPKDYRTWKEQLVEKDNASFQLFEGLYHLFMPGYGTYLDYDTVGNVSEEVINAIARWVERY